MTHLFVEQSQCTSYKGTAFLEFINPEAFRCIHTSAMRHGSLDLGWSVCHYTTAKLYPAQAIYVYVHNYLYIHTMHDNIHSYITCTHCGIHIPLDSIALYMPFLYITSDQITQHSICTLGTWHDVMWRHATKWHEVMLRYGMLQDWIRIHCVTCIHNRLYIYVLYVYIYLSLTSSKSYLTGLLNICVMHSYLYLYICKWIATSHR